MNEKDKNSSDQSTVFGVELGMDVDKRVLKMSGVLILEIVVLLVSGFLLVKPRWDELQRLRGDLSVQQIQLKNMQAKLEALELFEVERSNYDKVLSAAFPTSKDVGLVLSSLRSLASDSSIEVIGYSVDPVVIDSSEKKPAEFGSAVAPQAAGQRTKTENFMMEVTISGRALDIQAFLDRINASMPLKVVENVIITSGTEIREESNELLEMRLKVKNYFLPLTQKANPSGLVRALSSDEYALIDKMNEYSSLVLTTGGAVREDIPLGNQNLFGL